MSGVEEGGRLNTKKDERNRVMFTKSKVGKERA